MISDLTKPIPPAYSICIAFEPKYSDCQKEFLPLNKKNKTTADPAERKIGLVL